MENRGAPNGFSWRAFGTDSADLELDFFHGSRPELITRILTSCLETSGGRTFERGFKTVEGEEKGKVNCVRRKEGGLEEVKVEETIWNMSIGERTQHLLSIALEISPSLSLTLTCPHEGCNEPMEITLSVDSLNALQDEMNDAGIVSIPLDTETLVMRKPTGLDQKKWLERSYPSEQKATEAMISTLRSVDSKEMEFSKEGIAAINDAMDEADPLVNFGISAVCPNCGLEKYHVIDLEQLAISRLRGKQQRLIRTVHTLASRYHWTEHEILSLPPWRRSHYVSLIEQQEPV